MSKERCDNCRFMREADNGINGECFRYPPVTLPYGKKILSNGIRVPMTASYNPAVDFHGWCGEWQPKKGCNSEMLKKVKEHKKEETDE